MDAGIILKTVGWAFFPVLGLPMLTLLRPTPRLTNILNAVVRTIDTANHIIGEIIKWTLPALVLTVAGSVFMLSVFGVASVKWLESAFYFQALIVLGGSAATLLAGQHVRVDVFHQNMSDRQKAYVEFAGYYVFLLPVCLLILWTSQGFVALAWSSFEGSSEAEGIRGVFLLKTLIPVFAVTMLAQGLAIASRAALFLCGEEDPARVDVSPPLFETADPT